MKKSRNTLAKKIAAATECDEAKQLATFGRTLSPIEDLVLAYLALTRNLKGSMHNLRFRKIVGDRRAFVELIARLTESLLEEMWKALDTGDSSSLRQVANMVEAVFEHGPNDKDPVRAHLLRLRTVLEDRGEMMPLNDVAAIMNYRRTDDGWSYLRRLCRQLKFPLQTDKRKKKS